MPQDKWAAYTRLYAELSPRMEKYVRAIAEAFPNAEPDVWDDNADDYGWHVGLTREDGTQLDIRLLLADSGGYETGVYGKAGNLLLDIVEDGGRIVGQYAPHNYTAKVWANYANKAEWAKRAGFLDDPAPAIDCIRAWFDAIICRRETS